MQYTKLGNTGMDVSCLCLGCMGFGDAERWTHKWVLNEQDSRPVIQKALDLGINFFDTANIYSIGASEEITGRALKDFAKRDEIVLATKVWGKMADGPNGGGLSRKAILSEIDKSLVRLGTDYVDLYQIHRWDYQTPIEETMEALNDVVRAGKARYIGASAMFAWQFQKAQFVAEKHGWSRFVSMQNHLNLIYREEEREMLPLCRDQKIGVIPYSPLASGRLTRDLPAEGTLRAETDQIQKWKYDASAETDKQIVARVAELAQKRGASRVQIALAWLLQKEPVTAPIVGATKLSHLEDAVGALEVKLTTEEVACLEEPYVPHQVVGAQ
jgi:1-deoxyxylulose-5-phosphate synthase